MNSRFNWYNNNQVAINPGQSWTGKLLSYVDINESNLPTGINSRSPVLIRIDNYHIQINSIKKFNTQAARRGPNMVVVSRERGNWSNTLSEGLLSEGESYTFDIEGESRRMTVHVCKLEIGRVDYAELSIYPEGQSNGCNGSAPPSGGDPECANGIEANGVCCASSCGSCGGGGCARREGGSSNCCTSRIADAGNSCNTNQAPCVM